MAMSRAIGCKRLILILLLVSLMGAGFAAVRKEFTDLEKLYETGKLNELAAAINTLKPANDDEKACLGFMNAQLKVNTEDNIKAYLALIEQYPKSEYSQKSLLELGKILILERRIDEAIAFLRRITSSELVERYYWLGLCSWWNEDYANTISNAETYLRMDPKGAQAESAYYLIADSYLEQKKAYSAVSTLTKLQSAKLPNIDEQYYCYRLGYAYEMSEKLVDAVATYKKGYELNKYSQVAYLIEDRLFEVRSRSRSIDISFLYPYSMLQIEVKPEAPVPQDPDSVSGTKPVIPTPQITQTVEPLKPDSPVKVKAKPASGYWLQAGRFSVEANANKLVVNIRMMNLPAVYYEDISSGKKSWVVISGAYPDKDAAETARKTLSDKTISSFVTQY